MSGKSNNTVSIKGSQHSATGKQSTSSQQSLVSKGEDPLYGVDDCNQLWEDGVGGYYERLAVENDNGHAFDRASVHPAFGGSNAQSDALQHRTFEPELEVGCSEQEAIWKNADSYGAIRTPTSQQSIMSSFTTKPEQQPPCNPLPRSMLQDDSRANKRFRNIATSSVFANNETVQPVPLRSQVPPAAQSYTQQRNVAAPSSVYTNTEPARPHPPQIDVSPFAVQPQHASSGLVKGEPSRRLRPDAADHPSTGLPYRPAPVSSGRPNRPATSHEKFGWEEEDDIVERPTFQEYYENKRKPVPLPPSGRRQHYGRRPSPPPQPRPLTSRLRPAAPGSPGIPDAARTLTLDEVRRMTLARGPAAPSDVLTIWPHDSITSVGMPG
ncbi:uncharacterized protein ColSpa_08050 [Colletotrichum spaethianum]|uniref:Uncharacterized protein n=1 Tax=Colletotrichum spaethianum TaxID=700344 RepID=A0AA37P917_9PEZI|nr:uncharacterized protein ColSpa_08050 [Colletotrichum spaethianum]GKT47869.1 hypothetical protein ColSpa_08050 [Colletotrichum spaethianum]